MELDDGVLYQDDSGSSAMMSERVSGLASSIYREFERLISQYDEDVVKELMPLVVAVLENLDAVFAENQEHEVELELLKEDNEQLVTQYEREKSLRKSAEERYIVFEDSQETEKKDLQNRLVLMESHARQIELKTRNYSDQIGRLEEREAELKKEYNALHQRHTEMIHSYMEHLERTKHQQHTGVLEAPSDTSTNRLRKERPISMGLFSLPGTDLTPDPLQDPTETPSEPWKHNDLNHPRSNTSLKVTTFPTTCQSPLRDAADKDTGPSEVQAIIESTPELDMDLSGHRDASTPTKGEGIENLAFDRNTESLFAELSSAGPDMEVDIADMDEGADLLGMGREVEHLIQENTQLLETKNALNVVKNDLIAQVDELSCEKEALKGELEAVTQAKTRLEERNKELEEELKRVRAEAEEADVPTAQRKRFTRVEMARVLMERNQYKERLMELQEAVRWTEMIRASRETFPFCFSSGGAAKKPSEAAPVNVKYNAPSSQVQPTVKKRSAALQQLPSDKSKAFDFLNEESEAGSMVSRREQKRAQYRQVKAHVQKEEDGRVQAYGWSLPQKFKVANGGQTSENKMKNLPVPVYLRPLDEKDAAMKLWCAAGVNLSGGKTRDGGSIVGASVFYSDLSSPGPESPRRKTGSQSSLDKLDLDLKEQEKELRHHEELSSLVWICTSTQSTTKVIVIDANQPGNILENFFVCNSHVLCIASVPGARETDYPAGEEVPHGLETSGPESGPQEASSTRSGSGGEAGVLAGINVVGCSTEGAVATPQTAGAENETDSDSKAAEEATEATEASAGPAGPEHDRTQRGVYTEHVFTDPLGVPMSPIYSECDLVKDGVSSNPNPEEQDLMREEAQKMSSVLPTMWLGAQNGCVYVHSSVAQWRKCLHSIKLKDSILGIVHVKGRVLVALADGTLAIFHRGVDGQWDLTNYHLLDLGRPHHSIRCMTVVHDKVWCGYRNKIYVVQPKAMKIEKSFDAHPRKESQVRQLAWDGDGIWVSIRLDSTLRLFHAHTHQHLQDVDIEPYVSKMLGERHVLSLSTPRPRSTAALCPHGPGPILSESSILWHVVCRLNWPGGQNNGRPGGVIRVYSDENSDKVTAGTSVPFCSMAHAQLCFHGHRDAVKFFTAVPGQVISSGSGGGAEVGGEKGAGEHPQQLLQKSVLVMSGGEGYIDFRMGDEAGESEEPLDEPTLKLQPFLAKAERSHLIVWQVMDSQD
uniref:Sperm associated antigen 9 n=1 Tax=Esox lucius TaxID=8010 RepID=A0A6Q2XIL2_ESOLU